MRSRSRRVGGISNRILMIGPWNETVDAGNYECLGIDEMRDAAVPLLPRRKPRRSHRKAIFLFQQNIIAPGKSTDAQIQGEISSRSPAPAAILPGSWTTGVFEVGDRVYGNTPP